MANEDVVSSHLTQSAATGAAFDLNRQATRYRAAVRYSVRKNPKLLTLKRWNVYVHSL